MKITDDDVLKKLKELSITKFTGFVKIGIQDYIYNHISLANDIDLPLTINTDRNDIINYLIMKIKETGSGTICFKYDSGDIMAYAYNVTYKGNSLGSFIYDLSKN